jgi:hypothetical protein
MIKFTGLCAVAERLGLPVNPSDHCGEIAEQGELEERRGERARLIDI